MTTYDGAWIAENLTVARGRPPLDFHTDCPVCGSRDNLHAGPEHYRDGRIKVQCKGCGATLRDVIAALEPGHTNGTGPRVVVRSHDTEQPVVQPVEAKARPRAWLAAKCNVSTAFLGELPISFSRGWIKHRFDGLDGVTKDRQAGTDARKWTPKGTHHPSIWPLDAVMPEEAVFTEGESDAIALRGIGIENAYAITGGSANPPMTEEWAALAGRGLRTAIIAFDADKAGREGSDKAIAAAVAAGLDVSSTRPQGYDPLLGTGKDWCDWVEAGGTLDSFPDATSTDHLFLRPADVEDLLANPPEMLIDGWLHKASILLIVGGPKDGKTSLAFGLLSACLRGSLFAGLSAKRMPGPVLVSEEGYVTLGEKVRRYDLDDYRLLTKAQNSGLRFAEVVTKAARLAEREGRPLLIDTLRAWGGIVNEGDASEVGRVLDTVRAAVIPRGIACIVIHQTNRGGTYRGTTELLAQVETMVEVSRDGSEEYGDTARTCRIVSRFEGAADPIVLVREEGEYRNAGAPRISLGRSNDAMVKRRRELKAALIEAPRTKEWVTATYGVSKDTALADLRAIGATERRSGPASAPKEWSVDGSVDDSVDASRQPEPASSVTVDERPRIRGSSRHPSTTLDARTSRLRKRVR
jgi:hypothetical protein